MVLGISLTDYNLLTAVKVGDVYLSPKLAQERCSNFCDILYEGGSDPYMLNLASSSSLIQFEGQYFAFCTKHQLKGRNIENIGLRTDDGYVVTAGAVYSLDGNALETESYDLVALNLTEAVNSHPALKQRFFSISMNNRVATGERLALLFAYGMIYERNVIDTSFSEALGPRLDGIHVVTAEFGGFYADTVKNEIGRMTFERRDLANLDGVSGGPVFALTETTGGYELKFLGVVITAGNGSIRFIKEFAIFRLFKKIFESPKT